jgi:hypothetical protein
VASRKQHFTSLANKDNHIKSYKEFLDEDTDPRGSNYSMSDFSSPEKAVSLFKTVCNRLTTCGCSTVSLT